MDPISIIVTALASGAAAGLKPAAEKAIKDAYEGIKELIKRKYSQVNIEVLEREPGSKTRQAVMKEDLARTDAVKDEELLGKAQEVLNRVQKGAPDVAGVVGVSLEDMKVMGSVNIADVIASGTGVRAKGIDVGRDFTATGIRAGQTGGSPNPQPRQ